LIVAFIRLVVIVTVPDASETQNGAGVLQVLLTESSVFVGIVLVVVYATRRMSA
jgi:hypothetical protein